MMTRTILPRLLLLVVLAAVVAVAATQRDVLDVAAVEQYVRQAGGWGPVFFILLFAIGTVVFLPEASSAWLAEPCSGRSGGLSSI